MFNSTSVATSHLYLLLALHPGFSPNDDYCSFMQLGFFSKGFQAIFQVKPACRLVRCADTQA